MQDPVRQHLIRLDLDVKEITGQLPEYLSLGLSGGFLSLYDNDNSHAELSVNFSSDGLSYRSRQHLGVEHVIKACQLKGQKQTSLLDATCGLGIDAFLLHQAGFDVVACEKHPVIHALLKDGLERFEKETSRKFFTLIYGDSVKTMTQHRFDVIYLDPMFPHKKKTAKNKKGMQLFQALYRGYADDTNELVHHALEVAGKRVVIKRPKNAPIVTKFKPTFQISGKTCRFDAYQLI